MGLDGVVVEAGEQMSVCNVLLWRVIVGQVDCAVAVSYDPTFNMAARSSFTWPVMPTHDLEADHANLQLKIKESDVRYEAQVRQIKLDWERGAREIDARFEKRRADILSARDDPSIRAEIEMMLSQNRDTEIAVLRRTCEEKFEEAERLHAEQKQRYKSESFKLISAMMVSARLLHARKSHSKPLPTARVPLPSQRPPSLPIPIAPRNDARLGAPNRSPHNPAAGGQHPLMPQTIRQQFPATDNPREVGLSPTLQSVARRVASPSSDPGQENRSPQFATPARPDEQLSVPAHPSPRPESALKRKANGETSQQSPATQPGPLKRPKVEAPRGDRSETSDLSPPDVDESPTPERAVSFAEVYGTPEKPATYKHVIVRFPDNITGQFYILRCDGHGVHFGEHPLRGAAKHLASAQHNFMSKAHTTAIETLGHRVVGCTQEMAEKNNAVVLKAFQNGYKAFNANNLSQAKRAELGFPPPDPLNSHRAAMHRKQLAGATSPVPCRFYVTSDGDSKSLVLILPQGDISRAGLRGTLADTGLFPDVTDGGQSSGMQKPPRCYVYREVDGRIAGIKGWAKGYEDGGISERKREFPVLCVDDPDFRNWTVGWVKAGSLSAFDFDGTNSGDIPFAREARQYFVDRILRQSGGRHSDSSPQDIEMKDVASDRDSDTDHASNRRTSYPHQEEAHAGSSTPTTAQLIAAQALGLPAPKQGGFTAINAGGGDNGGPSPRPSLEPPSPPGSAPNTGAASRRVIKIHAHSSNRHPANGPPSVVLPERPADGVPGPRKPCPGACRVPEINKSVLIFKDDGAVFTDPPLMRDVPLAKISPAHSYWEPSWKSIEDIVEPLQQKYQEKYDESKLIGQGDRCALNLAKQGLAILEFLKNGDLHPYQLVGKEWIKRSITNYRTLCRLVQLLTDGLPKMNLDVTPSEWVRHRLHEQYLELGDKFNVASWIKNANHDPKLEQLRTRNGFTRIGRPPAHVTRSANGDDPGSVGPKRSSVSSSTKRVSNEADNESEGASFLSIEEPLPEINKSVLSLKHDGVVFTDPPLMRGVPLAKISPAHSYWESSWESIEDIVKPLQQKHQEKYNQLEQSGSTHRDKHLANRDAKRGRMILKFLKDGELHPYQLVGKEWIKPSSITNYHTLYRLARLLTNELPKMNLDVTPSEWVRHRLYEQYLELGDKFNVALWIKNAHHDRKLEQLRTRNGVVRVRRRPAPGRSPPQRIPDL
ncbi:hypothetical protein B0J18DRAFT_469670 [Chaetomium sp. MPI-SDFR-AT-0129]|nr:hypothetical protein B0J18DRAFT_469670 [Chaetomium sp. MPI-SDFR-AT-0129]